MVTIAASQHEQVSQKLVPTSFATYANAHKQTIKQ
jgi:hypothetical protein